MGRPMNQPWIKRSDNGLVTIKHIRLGTLKKTEQGSTSVRKMHIKCMSIQANLWQMQELNPLADIAPTHKNLLHDKKQRKKQKPKKNKEPKKPKKPNKNQKNQKNQNHGGAVLGKTWVVFFVFFVFFCFFLVFLVCHF